MKSKINSEQCQFGFQNVVVKFMMLISCATIFLQSCNSSEDGFATSLDNSSIEYSVSGVGQPTIVFVHGGLGCNKDVWANQIDYFNKKNKVVTLSLAGHGNSKSKRTEYTMESFGEDVASVVNELKLKEIVLVGHSMGGIVCVEAARKLPEETIGIIGLDCLNEFELQWQEDMINGFLNWFSSDTENKIGDYIREMFTQETESTIVETTVLKYSKVDTTVFTRELDNWFHYQNEKFISTVQQLEIPITCIQNGDNVITTETNRKYNPRFNGVKMDSLLHFFIISYPDLVNPQIEKAVESFVQS